MADETQAVRVEDVSQDAAIEMARDTQRAIDSSQRLEEKAERAEIKAEEAEEKWQLTREMFTGLADSHVRLQEHQNQLEAKIEELLKPPPMEEPLVEDLSSAEEEADRDATEVAEVAIVDVAPPPQKRPRQPEARRMFG
jgi:hypothetical protein